MNRLSDLKQQIVESDSTLSINMSIHISEARVAQVNEVITSWCAEYSKPLNNAQAMEGIKRDFDPEAEWFDHGFHTCRKGHKAIFGLRKSFLHCNQPFRAEIKVIYHANVRMIPADIEIESPPNSRRHCS